MNSNGRVLALYVHDMKLEIGHSNSLIELIRNLPQEFLARFSEIRVIAFTSSDVAELFPSFQGKKNWVAVPFKKIKPVLFKSIFFQLWTFIYNRLSLSSRDLRIGIGISSLDVDAVSIQFIHHQWTEEGLKMEEGHFIRKLYKKLLFQYFEFCEKSLIRRPGIKFFSPAKFLTTYLRTVKPDLNSETIYSGVNLDRFEIPSQSRSEIFKDLIVKYPDLASLNIEKPIYLFVGAYERKGLEQALNILSQQKDPQLIIIGSPSLGKVMPIPAGLKVFKIKFSREIPKFYSLADIFIFPTIYEPFGLVLFEAMAMGLRIVTRESNVGASELLNGLPEIYFCDHPEFTMPQPKIFTVDERKHLRSERVSMLGNVSWEKAGKDLALYLTGP